MSAYAARSINVSRRLSPTCSLAALRVRLCTLRYLSPMRTRQPCSGVNPHCSASRKFDQVSGFSWPEYPAALARWRSSISRRRRRYLSSAIGYRPGPTVCPYECASGVPEWSGRMQFGSVRHPLGPRASPAAMASRVSAKAASAAASDSASFVEASSAAVSAAVGSVVAALSAASATASALVATAVLDVVEPDVVLDVSATSLLPY
jgi:hypothetical protein